MCQILRANISLLAQLMHARNFVHDHLHTLDSKSETNFGASFGQTKSQLQ